MHCIYKYISGLLRVAFVNLKITLYILIFKVGFVCTYFTVHTNFNSAHYLEYHCVPIFI